MNRMEHRSVLGPQADCQPPLRVVTCTSNKKSAMRLIHTLELVLIGLSMSAQATGAESEKPRQDGKWT